MKKTKNYLKLKTELILNYKLLFKINKLGDFATKHYKKYKVFENSTLVAFSRLFYLNQERMSGQNLESIVFI